MTTEAPEAAERSGILPSYVPAVAAGALLVMAAGTITNQEWIVQGTSNLAAALTIGSIVSALLLPAPALMELGFRVTATATAGATVWMVATVSQPTTREALQTGAVGWTRTLTWTSVVLLGILAVGLFLTTVTGAGRQWPYLVFLGLALGTVGGLVVARTHDQGWIALFLTVHVWGAVAWAGLVGIVALAFMKVSSHIADGTERITLYRWLPDSQPYIWFKTAVLRFSRLAGLTVLMVLSSAVAMLWGNIALLDPSELYGVALWAKICFALVLVGCGIAHRGVTLVRMLPSEARDSYLSVRILSKLPLGERGRAFKRWVTAESEPADGWPFLRLCLVELAILFGVVVIASALPTLAPWNS